VKSGEGSARFGKVWGGRIKWNLTTFERGENRVVSEAKKKSALLWRELTCGKLAFVCENRARW
jgi:hypothetical protein